MLFSSFDSISFPAYFTLHKECYRKAKGAVFEEILAGFLTDLGLVI